MSRLVGSIACESTSTESRIRFESTGGGRWEKWDRFLLLDGKPAYHIGNVCNTCAFFFKRLDGANSSLTFDELEKTLTVGISTLSPHLASEVARVLPAGRYESCLLSSRPTLTRPHAPDDYFCHEQVDLHGLDPFWGLPHDPRTEYYRLKPHSISSGRRLFEFIVPMFPSTWLKADVAKRYDGILAGGARPTALAISILDVKGPADYEGEDHEHLCLTHYLLDGHHKVWAAARLGSEIGLLSFFAVDAGVSTDAQQAEVLSILAASAA